MKPLEECRLYAFIDTGYLHGRPATQLAEELCQGGADLIQLRAKNSGREEIRCMAELIRAITERHGVGLVINDFPDIAEEVSADLCHLGQEDFFDRGWKHRSEVLGPGNSIQLGLSSHAPFEAERALAAGADYIAIGPVFATGTKPSAPPVTLSYVSWAAAHVTIPWFAIGGITLENIESVLEAGARRVCVVSAILNARDVSQACQNFKKALSSVPL